MKKIIYPFIIVLMLFSACQNDVLDKKPLDIITDATVWSDPALIDAYLTQIYSEISVFTSETSNENWIETENWRGPSWINMIADEGKENWILWGSHQTDKTGGLKIGGGVLEWWEIPYKTIRSLNEFIQRVPASTVEESIRKSRTAEARFLRAYNYFSMVKRYGGVPLITEPQKIEDSKESLYPARDPEQKIYDFVISEVDAIVSDLPETNSSSDYGRPTKYAALALKCRAALYAGSIAKFSTVQLNGLLGIPADAASAYFQKSYDAAKSIINSGHYALYDVDADKTKNFRNLFMVKNNPEVIFAKRHADPTTGGNSWSWDFCNTPKPHAWGAGNINAPYLEMAEEFEHVDGTSGTLDRTAIQQGLWTMDQLWGNKDPRFYATIWTMRTPWLGSTIDPHNGLILPNGTIQTSGSFNDVPALGTQISDNSFGTSFGVMKYLDETVDNNKGNNQSSSDYQVFRYGEVLLNLAEAAFELGKTDDALVAVNQIRTRAGIVSLTNIDREKVRHERKVELAFEGHRYWDLRRWRTAVSVLSVNRSGIRYILDYTTRKYKLEVLENIDGTVAPPVFFSYNYYLPITLARTGNNPNLVENPGYK
jgi:hypothetical protein